VKGVPGSRSMPGFDRTRAKYRFARNRRDVHESKLIPMKNPARCLLLLPLFLTGAALGLAQSETPRPGYTVVTEITFDEQGVPENATIVQSDDPTGDHTLEILAVKFSEQDKQPPRMKDGKPVKFKARRPFNFPVEGDRGEAANANRPVLRTGNQVVPIYPESLMAKGEIGGAIIELTIQADGRVQAARALRSSHPEFAEAALTALRQWTFLPSTGPGAPATSIWHAAIGFTANGRDLDLKWRLAPRPSIGGFIVGRAPPPEATAPTAPAPLTVPGIPAEKK
jgi:TonB family protein